MDRPRPVPPNLRVVEESAWVNGSKEAGLLLGRHSDARVADGEFEFDFAVIDSAAAARKRRLLPAR